MKVRVIKQARNGNAIDFQVINSDGEFYNVLYCHRTEHPLWTSNNIQCFYGNVDDGNRERSAFLRVYPDNNGDLIIKGNLITTNHICKVAATGPSILERCVNNRKRNHYLYDGKGKGNIKKRR